MRWHIFRSSPQNRRKKIEKNIQIKIEIMIALEQMDERQTFHDVVNQIQPQKQQEKNPKHI